MPTQRTQTTANDQFIKSLLPTGPLPTDYKKLEQWIENLFNGIDLVNLSMPELKEIRTAFGELYNSPKNFFGHGAFWPHGYPGDYEIIDKIYTRYISEIPEFKNWDRWFHTFAATKAVRNRKEYFKKLLAEKSQKQPNLTLLNLASGPCRDLLEFFEEYPSNKLKIDCVELDHNAIAYASELLGEHRQHVRFIHQNIFKFQSSERYDLIWSAGLFDYFDDRTFVSQLSRFLAKLKPNSELIIGNVHPRNPTKTMMDFSNWRLHYRTETDLINLAIQAGIKDYSKLKIEMEAEGVNLFLRISN